jgi:purine-cytosine permease-like protein
MKLPDKVYIAMKWIMLLATPVCTFILGILAAVATGEPAAIITAVIGGLGTLAGVIIKISDMEYRKEIEE